MKKNTLIFSALGVVILGLGVLGFSQIQGKEPKMFSMTLVEGKSEFDLKAGESAEFSVEMENLSGEETLEPVYTWISDVGTGENGEPVFSPREEFPRNRGTWVSGDGDLHKLQQKKVLKYLIQVPKGTLPGKYSVGVLGESRKSKKKESLILYINVDKDKDPVNEVIVRSLEMKDKSLVVNLWNGGTVPEDVKMDLVLSDLDGNVIWKETKKVGNIFEHTARTVTMDVGKDLGTKQYTVVSKLEYSGKKTEQEVILN